MIIQRIDEKTQVFMNKLFWTHATPEILARHLDKLSVDDKNRMLMVNHIATLKKDDFMVELEKINRERGGISSDNLGEMLYNFIVNIDWDYRNLCNKPIGFEVVTLLLSDVITDDRYMRKLSKGAWYWLTKFYTNYTYGVECNLVDGLCTILSHTDCRESMDGDTYAFSAGRHWASGVSGVPDDCYIEELLDRMLVSDDDKVEDDDIEPIEPELMKPIEPEL